MFEFIEMFPDEKSAINTLRVWYGKIKNLMVIVVV